ncbi:MULTISPECIES: CD225/dispanin family protein [Actinomadura]|uniref:CD225/dispanin family protein n=1 Tax=Actinomadura miaoliensis TaxID=430685 RepID=A0ABP7VEG2_9ACTN
MSYYGQQPGYGGYQPPSSPPPNHLVWAILTTILCCLPAGVVSIVYAAQVNSKWQSGDYQGAQSASNNARTWAIVSAVVGVVVGVVYFIVTLAAASNT